MLIPAIKPDVTIFHVPMADRFGNVWIGRRRELAAMAYASRTVLVTVERIVEENLLADEMSAAGVLPARDSSTGASTCAGAGAGAGAGKGTGARGRAPWKQYQYRCLHEYWHRNSSQYRHLHSRAPGRWREGGPGPACR